jgi:hypothetical protein
MTQSIEPKYRWYDWIKSEDGPKDPIDRWVLFVLGGWLRKDGDWSYRKPRIKVLARQIGLSYGAVKQRLTRLDGVCFDRLKVGRGYRYRPRFPTAEELTALPSLSAMRVSRKGHQSVTQSQNGNRDTGSSEKDANSYPVMSYQPVPTRPKPRRIDRAYAPVLLNGAGREAPGGGDFTAGSNDCRHRCDECGKLIRGDARLCVECHLRRQDVQLERNLRNVRSEPG